VYVSHVDVKLDNIVTHVGVSVGARREGTAIPSTAIHIYMWFPITTNTTTTTNTTNTTTTTTTRFHESNARLRITIKLVLRLGVRVGFRVWFDYTTIDTVATTTAIQAIFILEQRVLGLVGYITQHPGVRGVGLGVRIAMVIGSILIPLLLEYRGEKRQGLSYLAHNTHNGTAISIISSIISGIATHEQIAVTAV